MSFIFLKSSRKVVATITSCIFSINSRKIYNWLFQNNRSTSIIEIITTTIIFNVNKIKLSRIVRTIKTARQTHVKNLSQNDKSMIRKLNRNVWETSNHESLRTKIEHRTKIEFDQFESINWIEKSNHQEFLAKSSSFVASFENEIEWKSWLRIAFVWNVVHASRKIVDVVQIFSLSRTMYQLNENWFDWHVWVWHRS